MTPCRKKEPLSLFFMPRRKKRPGTGARCSVAARYLHPSELIRAKWPGNEHQKERIDNMTLLRFENNKRIRKKGKPTKVYFLEKLDLFPGQILYCASSNVRIDEEGDARGFFDTIEQPEPPQEQEPPQEEAPEEQEEVGTIIPSHLQRAYNFTANDITELRARGITVDDDDEPVEDNVPVPGEEVQEEEGDLTWGHSRMDPRRQEGLNKTKPKLKGVNSSLHSSLTLLQIWRLLFPISYVQAAIIPETNKHLGEKKLKLDEFIRWIGLWHFMACYEGILRRDWWSTKEIDPFDGAPFRFNPFMSRSRFDEILQALRYTDIAPPVFADKFHSVRQMAKAWNDNMEQNFMPGWLSCLDESMMIWHNKWTAPGFMFVPRKPHPFGNEWHSIGCVLSGVMYHMELVEGKDRPKELGPKEFEAEFEKPSATAALMVRMCKPIWNTGNVVVMDSGFCVLNGVLQMAKKGVYGASLIKKRRYWPKHVPGDKIVADFEGKEVGYADAIANESMGVKYHIYCMKEPDYTMMIMSTHGTLERVAEAKTKRCYKNDDGAVTTKEFEYPEPMHQHFFARHVVDDHNNRRHSPISIEETWGTKWWPHRNFAFLLGVTEVNVALVHAMINEKKALPQLEARKKLAKEMMEYRDISENNLEGANTRDRSGQEDHVVETIPNFSGKWLGTKWKKSTQKYLQQRCKCGKRTRNYCRCNRSVFLCRECMMIHRIEAFA